MCISIRLAIYDLGEGYASRVQILFPVYIRGAVEPTIHSTSYPQSHVRYFIVIHYLRCSCQTCSDWVHNQAKDLGSNFVSSKIALVSVIHDHLIHFRCNKIDDCTVSGAMFGGWE
jgi:hypothetical protein